MNRLVYGFGLGGAEGPFIIFSTLDHQMDEIQDVDVEGEERPLVRVGGGDGAKDGVQHEHRGYESFERIHEGGRL